MQMVLILVLGHTLAQSAPVVKGLQALAGLARGRASAIILVSLTATIAAWLNWGFGLVVGALVAREVGRQRSDVHFPLLVAAAYSGFLVWHAGLSGSIPLKVASNDNDALTELLQGQLIPVTETLFHPANLIMVFALLLLLPLLNYLMHPDEKHLHPFAGEIEDRLVVDKTRLTPAEKLEHLPLINFILAALCLAYLVPYFIRGGGLNLNIINMSLLVLGLMLHVNPHNYLQALKKAIGGASGIVLQFPIYAGIMGMMVQSGLADKVSQWFVAISTADTFPMLTFISAGIVNLFVPSGGGQWAVQAPIVIPAAQALGVPLNHAAMAVAWGDAWTNMVQPFWALPLLGIAGLSIRQIMGYCTMVLLCSGALIMLLMALLY